MKYFNGFSLIDEESIFKESIFFDILTPSDYTVVGFSYGAQKAFEYAYESQNRIEKLILLSPAFFQTEKKSFIRAQLRYFNAGKEAYVTQFLQNVASPSSHSLREYLNIGTQDELESLLTYVWDKTKIQTLLKRGTSIEVFLGTEDKIINSKEALAFFSQNCTTYSIKNVGHLLKEK